MTQRAGDFTHKTSENRLDSRHSPVKLIENKALRACHGLDRRVLDPHLTPQHLAKNGLTESSDYDFHKAIAKTPQSVLAL